MNDEDVEVTIPKEQIELMLLQANIELIQKVAKLIELLEKK